MPLSMALYKRKTALSAYSGVATSLDLSLQQWTVYWKNNSILHSTTDKHIA